MTSQNSLPFVLLILISCGDPELFPPDLGSPCFFESGIDPDSLDLRVESFNPRCSAFFCLVDPDGGDFTNYPTTREECEATPERMGECDGFEPAAYYEDRVYCSCRCPDQCACDAPGFECRDVDYGPDGPVGFCVKAP